MAKNSCKRSKTVAHATTAPLKPDSRATGAIGFYAQVKLTVFQNISNAIPCS